MVKYIDNNSNITFNNVSKIGTYLSSVPISKKNNYTFNEDESEILSINSKVFNAVDIDWNNAALNAAKPSEPTEGFPNGTVNTTGELLKNIANLQAQVDLLTTLVKGLYSALT